MGRFARSVAHIKNVTVDPIVVGSKFVGRQSKTGASFVAAKVSTGVAAVRDAEVQIDAKREIKREAREELAEVIEEVTTNVRAKAQKRNVKSAKHVKTDA